VGSLCAAGTFGGRLQSSESQGLDQTEPQAPVPSPSVAEGGLPHESYSKFKALIFKISTRGILITTRSLERQAGDMLTAPLECFQRARSLEVGQVLPAGSWHLSDMPQLDSLEEDGQNNQAKRRKKASKKQQQKDLKKIRVVIIGQYVEKKGRMIRSVRTAAWPLQPFQGAAQALSSFAGRQISKEMEPYRHAAEDVMTQHVRQALLTPPSLLELQPLPLDHKRLNSPGSELQDMFPAIQSLADAKVRLRSVPGGADALVPQHSLHLRSMGQAPHEPASVTMRSCSLFLEGELIRTLIFRIGFPLDVLEQGGWDRAMSQGWKFVRHVASLASDVRRSFPDEKRWCLLVRDACMGASSRILALTDVTQGATYGTSSGSTQPLNSRRSESRPKRKVNGTEKELEHGLQLAALGRWRALASSLLQLAKADLLSMPAPGSSEGDNLMQVYHTSLDMSDTCDELYNPKCQDLWEVEQQERQEAKKPHLDMLHRRPALLPSLGLVVGVEGEYSKCTGGRSSIWSLAGLDLFEDPALEMAGIAGDQGTVADSRADDENLPSLGVDRESQGKEQNEKKERERLSCVLRSSPHAVDVLEYLASGLKDSCIYFS